jgi:hypothetical protein
MHLGYHELRNMLSKFREERERRKMAPPSSVPSGLSGTAAPPSGPPSRSSDYRARGGDEYRERSERDRGYDRSSSRYELVFSSCCPRSSTDVLFTVDGGIESAQEVQEDGDIEYFIHSGSLRPYVSCQRECRDINVH